MSLRKILLQKRVRLFGLPASQLLAVLTALEHVQGVYGGVTRLVGNTLSIHGGNEFLGSDAREGVAINMKNVRVLSIAGALGR